MPGTPWVIDVDARVSAQAARLLAYMATDGQQGVLGATHLRVGQLLTPGAQVQVMPGAFAIRHTGVGGAFESYVGKFETAETLALSPTGASSRTDLVIARVENPHAVGTGTWAYPADPVAGPYWYMRAIEGVTPANIPDVKTWNATWSAIPLARITRPPNTGIVQDSHITDLRSLVDLSGERITIINNPAPPTPETPAPQIPTIPPVAQQVWTGVLHLSVASTLARNQTAWIDWPAAATFQVPIPSWARDCDIMGSFNPQYDGNIYGEIRTTFGGNAASAVVFDRNADDVWQRDNIPVVGTYVVPENQRGQVVTVRLQAHMLDPSGHDGTLKTRNGVYLAIQLNFKRAPGA
jgi:hypothetical protein